RARPPTSGRTPPDRVPFAIGWGTPSDQVRYLRRTWQAPAGRPRRHRRAPSRTRRPESGRRVSADPGLAAVAGVRQYDLTASLLLLQHLIEAVSAQYQHTDGNERRRDQREPQHDRR